MNPIRWLLTQYVKRSKRFEGQKWEYYEDENGPGYKCPVCGNIANEPWKICENCFYPLPLFGNGKRCKK